MSISASIEMPQYQCHKKVWALKIKDINVSNEDEASITIVPEEERYAPFPVGQSYFNKHEPEPGGYFVVYPGGYQLYSPAEAFEEGYSLIKKQ